MDKPGEMNYELVGALIELYKENANITDDNVTKMRANMHQHRRMLYKLQTMVGDEDNMKCEGCLRIFWHVLKVK